MSRTRLVTLVMTLSQIIVTADACLALTALPQVGREFHVSAVSLSWVITANLLTVAGLQMLAGRITDVLGQRRSLVFSLILYVAGSALVALSPSLLTLIVARVIAGLAITLLNPASFSLINTEIPDGPERDFALGAYGTAQGFGLILGLVLSGLLMQFLGWRGTFLLMVPIAVGALLLGLRVVKRFQPAERIPLSNAPAATLLTLSIVCLTWAVSEIAANGFTLLGEVALCASVGAMLLFGLVERRGAEPLIPPDIFRSRSLMTGSVGNFLIMAGTVPVFALPNLYMQGVLGYPSGWAGLGMAPLTIAAIAAGYAASPLLRRWDVRVTALIGFLAATLGNFVLVAGTPLGTYASAVAIGGVLVAIGYTWALLASMGIATSEVHSSHQGTATGIAMMIQYVGSSVGVAIALGLLAGTGGEASAGRASSYGHPFLFMALTSLTGVLLCLVATRRPSARSNDPVSEPKP